MDRPAHEPDPEQPRWVLYDALLAEAGEVSEHAMDRLHRLAVRYPHDLPAPLVEQLSRGRTDPRQERRRTVRLLADDERLRVRPGGQHRAIVARVLDRSPGGVRIRVGRPLAVGDVVSLPSDDPAGWAAHVVRYCQREAAGWVAGCERA